MEYLKSFIVSDTNTTNDSKNDDTEEEKKIDNSNIPDSLGVDIHSTDNDQLKISILPPSLQNGLKRLPMMICCVVDTSGSMGCDAIIKDENGKSESHGLSILDLVKHSIKTIIECLGKKDYLSIISYSNKAKIITNLIKMTKKNKKKTLKALESLQADGQTNLWDGLFQGLEQLRKCKEINTFNNNSTIMLFTDGLPNIIPPKGHIEMLNSYIKQYKQLNGCINTYGFGYSLDTQLLTQLAIKGNGYYSFIPDSTMVGTIFVHAISNFAANIAKNVIINVNINKDYDSEIIGGYDYINNENKLQINLGNIMYYYHGVNAKMILNPVPLIKDSVLNYLYYHQQMLEALSSIEVKNKCIYQFDVYIVPTAVVRTNALNKSIVIQASNLCTIQYTDYENVIISDPDSRHSNALCKVKDLMQQNSDEICGCCEYQQDVLIIKRNTVNLNKDVLYKYSTLRQPKITNMNCTAVERFCLNNTENHLLDGLKITDSGILTLSYRITDSNIQIYYSYGYGNGRYHGKVLDQTLSTSISMFFEQKTQLNYHTSFVNKNIDPCLSRHLNNTINKINANIDNKNHINIDFIVEFFIQHKIGLSYFESRLIGRRLKFIHLLKQYCRIKASYAGKIFDNLHLIKTANSLKTQQKIDLNYYDQMIKYRSQLQEKQQQIDKLKMILRYEKKGYHTMSKPDKCDNKSGLHISTLDRDKCDFGFSNVDVISQCRLDEALCSKYNLCSWPYNVNVSFYSNIVMIITIIVADYLQRFTYTKNSLLYKYQSKCKIQMSNVDENEHHSTDSVTDELDKEDTESKSTGYEENNNKEIPYIETHNNHNGNVACCGGSAGGNGGGGDKHNKDNHNDDKNDTDEDENEEETNEENDEKTSNSTTKLNPNAAMFTLSEQMCVRESTQVTVDAGDVIVPGSVAISRELTNKIIPRMIKQKFKRLYWFMNKSLIFPDNKIVTNNNICVINYDFTDKKTNETLYCVVEAQDNQSKYKWRMCEDLFTTNQLKSKFNISHDQLPRSNNSFKIQTRYVTEIESTLKMKATKIIFHQTKWTKVPVFTRKNNTQRMTLSITKTQFEKHLIQLCSNEKKLCPLIPILVFENNNKYHIEFIWIIRISDNDIGISLRYMKDTNIIKITGIHLDKQFILNQHQLISSEHCNDCICLKNFKSNINDLCIGNIDDQKNQNKNLRKQCNELKRKLKQVIENSLSNPNKEIKNSLSDNDEQKASIIEQNIEIKKQSNSLSTDSSTLQSDSLPLNIVTDISKSNINFPSSTALIYPVMITNSQMCCMQPQLSTFPLAPIPPLYAICSSTIITKIFIPIDLTNEWLPHILETFNDSKMLYYDIKHCIQLQINYQMVRIYYNKWIINLDLHDKAGNELYAIIDEYSNSLNDKYNWKVIEIANRFQLLLKYNIPNNRFPCSSRMTTSFLLQINSMNRFQNVQFMHCVIDNIKAKSILVIKNKSNSVTYSMSITISKLRKCLKDAVNNNTEYIPILRFKDNSHWIEWIVICNTPNGRHNFGVSFKYDNGVVKATTIFLNGKDIMKQNMLTRKPCKTNILKYFQTGLSNMIVKKSNNSN